MLKIVLILVSCLTIPVPLSAYGYNLETVYLDSHVHIDLDLEGNIDDAQRSIEEFFNKGIAKKAILVSPAYIVDPYVDFFNGNLSLRQAYNKKTSEIVSSLPSRLIGLCGLGYQWEDGMEVVKECLNLPGMAGVKIRIVDDYNLDRLSTPFILDNITRTLHKNKETIRLVLIHMPGIFAENAVRQSYPKEQLDKELKADSDDIKKLVELARQFPKIQFVVAHSFYSYQLVNILADQKNKYQLDNVWLDVSQSLTHGDPEHSVPGYQKTSWLRFANSWRNFGIDKVLFGSDQNFGATGVLEIPNDDGKAFKKELESIVKNPYLEDRDKDHILVINGKEFFKLISK